MPETLANIQLDARHWANDAGLTLTSSQGLRVANTVYRAMLGEDWRLASVKIGRRWAEVTREDTSLTMVVSQEQYTWPLSPVFKKGVYIEGLDASASNEPYIIREAVSMDEWSALDDSNDATPILWRKIDVAGVTKLALRPNPDSADGIRITGLIEPIPFPAVQNTITDASSASGQNTVNVAATAPFTAGCNFIIAEGTTAEEHGTVVSVIDGASFAASANLANTHASGVAVAFTTAFNNKDADVAFSKLIAADYKLKRGESNRGSQLVIEALGLLPERDTTPVFRGSGHIQPWAMV